MEQVIIGVGPHKLSATIEVVKVQLRNDTEGRAYFRRKVAAGKTPMEALRCLDRRLSDVLYRRLVAVAQTRDLTGDGTGPGGHCGATQESSAADLPPYVDTSDQPLPGPARPTLPRPIRTRKPTKTGLEEEPANLVGTDGTVTDGPRPDFIGGITIVDVPSREDALKWAAKIAAACRCT